MSDLCSDNYSKGMREFLNGCKLNGSPSGTLRGRIDGTIEGAGGMPNNPTPIDVIVYRRHPFYAAREKQLMINLLGLEGGRPYVETRLSRYSGETEIDWIGGSRPDGSSSTGRLQQTHAFPYLGRINDKINQYVFQEIPVREGEDPEITADISRDSSSVNDLMREASGYLFACKWCWLMVDAPAPKEGDDDFTIAEKNAQKIRPYWQVLSPLDVLDWHFNEQGDLEWIKTQSFEYDDSNPATLPTPKRVIKLWEKGKCTKFTIIEKKDRRFSNGQRTQVDEEEILLTDDKGQPLKVVPFTLIGDASAKPIAFDDLESINRTIMDLGSVDRSSYFNGNYPQLTLPKSLMTNAMQDNYSSVGEEIRLMLGFKYPIMLDTDDKEPKYLSPDASALKGGAEYTAQLKRELFEVVGLALEQDSKQVASAESKAWDAQDVSAVMTARAETLEDAERRGIAISQAWDSEFQAWEPKYSRDFDIGNFKDEISSLVMAGNMNLPDGVARLVVQKLTERLDRVGSPTNAEEMTALLDEIKGWSPNEFMNLPVSPA